MAVVLISAKSVTNMKQFKKMEYEGNEAASREDKPQYSRKKLTVAKTCYLKRILICKDNYQIHKLIFFKFPYGICAGMSASHNVSPILYWNLALPFCKKSIPRYLPSWFSSNVVPIAQTCAPILGPHSCQQ